MCVCVCVLAVAGAARGGCAVSVGPVRCTAAGGPRGRGAARRRRPAALLRCWHGASVAGSSGERPQALRSPASLLLTARLSTPAHCLPPRLPLLQARLRADYTGDTISVLPDTMTITPAGSAAASAAEGSQMTATVAASSGGATPSAAAAGSGAVTPHGGSGTPAAAALRAAPIVPVPRPYALFHPAHYTVALSHGQAIARNAAVTGERRARYHPAGASSANGAPATPTAPRSASAAGGGTPGSGGSGADAASAADLLTCECPDAVGGSASHISGYNGACVVAGASIRDSIRGIGGVKVLLPLFASPPHSHGAAGASGGEEEGNCNHDGEEWRDWINFPWESTGVTTAGAPGGTTAGAGGRQGLSIHAPGSHTAAATAARGAAVSTAAAAASGFGHGRSPSYDEFSFPPAADATSTTSASAAVGADWATGRLSPAASGGSPAGGGASPAAASPSATAGAAAHVAHSWTGRPAITFERRSVTSQMLFLLAFLCFEHAPNAQHVLRFSLLPLIRNEIAPSLRRQFVRCSACDGGASTCGSSCKPAAHGADATGVAGDADAHHDHHARRGSLSVELMPAPATPSPVASVASSSSAFAAGAASVAGARGDALATAALSAWRRRWHTPRIPAYSDPSVIDALLLLASACLPHVSTTAPCAPTIAAILAAPPTVLPVSVDVSNSAISVFHAVTSATSGTGALLCREVWRTFLTWLPLFAHTDALVQARLFRHLVYHTRARPAFFREEVAPSGGVGGTSAGGGGSGSATSGSIGREASGSGGGSGFGAAARPGGSATGTLYDQLVEALPVWYGLVSASGAAADSLSTGHMITGNVRNHYLALRFHATNARAAAAAAAATAGGVQCDHYYFSHASARPATCARLIAAPLASPSLAAVGSPRCGTSGTCNVRRAGSGSSCCGYVCGCGYHTASRQFEDRHGNGDAVSHQRSRSAGRGRSDSGIISHGADDGSSARRARSLPPSPSAAAGRDDTSSSAPSDDADHPSANAAVPAPSCGCCCQCTHAAYSPIMAPRARRTLLREYVRAIGCTLGLARIVITPGHDGSGAAALGGSPEALAQHRRQGTSASSGSTGSSRPSIAAGINTVVKVATSVVGGVGGGSGAAATVEPLRRISVHEIRPLLLLLMDNHSRVIPRASPSVPPCFCTVEAGDGSSAGVTCATCRPPAVDAAPERGAPTSPREAFRVELLSFCCGLLDYDASHVSAALFELPCVLP